MADDTGTKTLREMLITHIAGDDARDEKLDKVYQTVVTGNGHEALTTTVLRNTEWINSVKKIIWAAAIAMLGIVISSVASLIYMIFKIYPILQQIEKLEPYVRTIKF